jgi:predicted ATPase
VPVVVDICRKLDGIPLAIELAAASIAALGLQGIAARLDHPLRLPGTRRRTAALRHQTLHAALDWSYRLLTEEEQRVLRRLSVFAGSFTMDAAAAVAADPTYAESDIVDRVVALVSKSLVAADPVGSFSRLRLLATTRAYARIAADRDWWSERAGEHYRELAHWLRGVAAKCRLPATQKEILNLARRYEIRANHLGSRGAAR